MHGSWVGTVCSWCHCPLESGGTSPPQGDAAQPPRLNPRMAELATAQLQPSRQLPGNQHGKTTEERRREHTTERQARRPSRGSWNVTPAAWKHSLVKVVLRGALACWHSGLRAVTQVRVCSSQTRNLSLSFSELLVATCGAQSLERPGKPNS